MKQRTPTRSSCGLSLLFLLSLLWEPTVSNAKDSVTISDSFRNDETIISSGGNFEMGFFSPGSSNIRYLGIWYKNIPLRTVVWVANRETPLFNASGVFKVVSPGIFVILNDTNHTIWSTNTSRIVKNPVAQLLDSGNLVVKDANDSSPQNYLWQSFDFPTDTLLAEMKIGWNFETGREVYLSSSTSNDDPAPGDYTFHCDPSGYPQCFIIKKNSLVTYRSGPWIGSRFSGSSNSRLTPIYSIDLVSNDKEVYFTFHSTSTVISRYVLDPSGVAQRLMWVDRTQGWVRYLSNPDDNCDLYQLCGPNGICRIQTSPFCECLNKFVPKFPNNWTMADWSSGCVRRTPLDCKKGDVFLKYSSVKLPDTRKSWYNGNMTLVECKLRCSRNCSCMAYANSDIRNGGSGCLLWFDELIDIKELAEGQDIYIRMASSELDSMEKRRKILIVVLPLLSGMLLLGLCLVFYLLRHKRKGAKLKYDGRKVQRQIKDDHDQNHESDPELVMFDLATITKATNNFSQDNKLGEGGYGPVYKVKDIYANSMHVEFEWCTAQIPNSLKYKGMLVMGQEIAVKRLAQTSHQGCDEFKNEHKLIAKLQHRNLVRLLGCCVEGEEKMLIYEYMHNKSLDLFIFDKKLSKSLDWPTRFHIINGIARGLMYLHQDSRLRIVHRDLKASNILLDIDMNPKISDFGMARSFIGNETEAKTLRVIGTYGYMSPEYAIHGHFSVKSDVFSFGVSVLEIVSGKRNRGFAHPDNSHNLLSHAWVLYKEGKALELVTADLDNAYHSHEVLRSIHVGLLCVQQNARDRPTMSTVVLMLSNDGDLPMPKQPGFFVETNKIDGESFARTHVTSSIKDLSITVVEPR